MIVRLLLVEDDGDLADAVRAALARRGLACDHAATAEDALLMLGMAAYTAVLLDLGLPDADGTRVLARLRGQADPIPVVILTARGDVASRIAGLDAGADDYLVKPFDMDELLARLRAVLRRPTAMNPDEIVAGNLSFDLASRLLRVGGAEVTLSAREAELADLLLRRLGQVVPKRLAEDQLFGMEGGLGSNAVEVYVHRLRRKLEAAGAGVAIETVRGIGYRLRAEA